MELDAPLDIPTQFPFPFPPYDIQCQFMEKLYFALENKKLGIFESPTGTGKSLSILCGAIKWLKDHNNHVKSILIKKIEMLEAEKEKIGCDKEDWFSIQSEQLLINHKINELKIEDNKMNNYNKKIDDIKTEAKKLVIIKSRKYPPPPSTEKSKTKPNDIETIELDDKSSIDEADVLLEETDQNCADIDDEPEEEENKFHQTQIIIASRTHSQLAQFIGEIMKSPFAKDVRVVSLASRQNYCINSDVKKLNNQALMNQRCLDMQKKRSEANSQIDSSGKVTKRQRANNNCQCKFYKPLAIDSLKNFALTELHDIEDLLHMGKEMTACPYYASRKAAEDAEIILVPYNTLLHKSTREANGLHIKDNVVIIDEAHNLLESLSQMYGSDLYYPQLFYSLEQLKYYKQRYNTKFSANNLRHLNQLIFVVNKLLKFLDKEVKVDVTDIFTVESFVASAEIEEYNFFNLIKFCKASKLAQKIRAYSLKYALKDEMQKKPTRTTTKSGIKDFLASIENKKPSTSKEINQSEEETKLRIPIPNNPLLAVISFLESLTYLYSDGRILMTRNCDKQQSKMQFLLLNPSSNFKEIIQEARAVIVAGGTMKPYSEFRDRLFRNCGAETERILEFSCDHIIPKTNILPIILTRGVKEEKLLFNFNNRMLLASSVKDILIEACNHVKGGIVVFFPSYSYETFIYDAIKNVNFGRKLFREPQNSTAIDNVLSKYATTVAKSDKGALMFSVVGGKLSEGLNFSDDLGRCIIVIGMPYANIMAADLKEKMSYLDQKEGSGSGQKFYENLCMKSVNQCIGRAVRHRNDYASVLLVDDRYARQATREALPDWIRRSLKICEFKETFNCMEKFFKDKTTEASA